MLDLVLDAAHCSHMNKLSSADRARILHLLCEGQAIRAVTRLTGASKNTVTKLLIDAGKACEAYTSPTSATSPRSAVVSQFEI